MTSTILPSNKNGRSFSVLCGADGTAIIDGKGKGNIAEYAIAEFEADGGRAFEFEKIEGGSDREASGYTVFVATRPGVYSSCECRGFIRWGRCKHLDTARVMVCGRTRG